MIDREEQTKALAHAARLAVLAWLKEPGRHFAHQESGDPVDIGVCVTLIADKLGLAQPTASRHLDLLRRAGFVRAEKRGRWSFYRRDAAALADYRRWLDDAV